MSSSGGSESSAGARAEGAHLDEDAECLEDPVHSGDARHQHDVHDVTAVDGRVDPESDEPAQA